LADFAAVGPRFAGWRISELAAFRSAGWRGCTSKPSILHRGEAIMRNRKIGILAAFALVGILLGTIHPAKAAQERRNAVERIQDRQELRQDRRQLFDDRSDLARLRRITAAFQHARQTGDRAAIDRVDGQVLAYLEGEISELSREAAQARLEVRRSRRELASERRELRRDRALGAPPRVRADDRRDLRDDRRDLLDDRRDARAERARLEALRAIRERGQRLVGVRSPGAMEERAILLARLRRLARGELAGDLREIREDRRETREDRIRP
jgi:hypothetical protein